MACGLGLKCWASYEMCTRIVECVAFTCALCRHLSPFVAGGGGGGGGGLNPHRPSRVVDQVVEDAGRRGTCVRRRLHQFFNGLDASQSRYSVSLSSSMVCPCSHQNVVNASKGKASAEGFSTSAMFTLESTGMKVCLASTDSAATRASCTKQSLIAKPQPNNIK